MRPPIVRNFMAAGNGVAIAVQPNGERLRVELWALESWQRNDLRDPMLCRILDNAVEIIVP